MMSLYGRCFGVVKNAINTGLSNANCYAQSGAKRNYALAKLENAEVCRV